MIAFLLQTHFYNQHIERLCRVLYEFTDSHIYLHHDFSQSEFPEDLIRNYKIKLIEPYRRTAWADVSQTYAEFDLLKFAFDDSINNLWFILLSGACYPIKSINYIQNFLLQSKHDGYMDITQSDPKGNRLQKRWHQRIYWKIAFELPFISQNGVFYYKKIRIPRSNTPFSKSYPLYFGSNWFILKRNAVDYILSQNPWNHPIMSFFERCKLNKDKEVISSDEVILNTLLGNQKTYNIHRNYLRYIDWQKAINYHPNVLTINHWQDLKKTDALFARKFDSNKSLKLIKRINEEILDLAG